MELQQSLQYWRELCQNQSFGIVNCFDRVKGGIGPAGLAQISTPDNNFRIASRPIEEKLISLHLVSFFFQKKSVYFLCLIKMYVFLLATQEDISPGKLLVTI